METPIKTEYYLSSEMDVGDQNEGFEMDPEKEHDDWNVLKTKSEVLNSSDQVTENNFKERIDTPDLEIDLLDIVKEEPFADDLDGIRLEDTNQDSTSDSEDNMPLQNFKHWKADRLKKKSKVSLRRSNESKIETSKILKPDARETILSKDEQLQQTLERSKSQSYQNSPFKCNLCYKGFEDTKAFENHQEIHAEVLHLPKKRKSDNETEKERLQSQAPLKKTVKVEEKKAQIEEIPDFKICNKKNKTIKIIPNNETTTSNINRDIKNSKIEANSNKQVKALNNIFICDVCKKEYLCKSLLANHIKKWHIVEIDSKSNWLTDLNKNYQNCKKDTNLLKGKDVVTYDNVSENILSTNKNNHKDSICSDETQYKCSYCSKSFNGRAQLARHERTHTGEKPYKCSYCTKCFSDNSHLARHVKTHTGKKPYKCSYCMKCFFENSQLARHVRTHTGEKPYKCSYCMKCFFDNSQLARHVRTHTGEKPYKCSYCTKCFFDNSNLARHVKTHTGKKPYKCSYCMKCFFENSQLARHVRTHTGEKPYKCSYCTKCFFANSQLAIHIRTHTGETPYKCSYCTKCFTSRSVLTEHIRIHTGEKPYKCSYCTKCFTQSSDLIIHVRIHTGDKPYKCSYCIKCFTKSGDLAAHVRIHTGEKPYKCSYCIKCFTKSGDLAKHVRIHTGEKPYKCIYCTKCFTYSSALATHVRIHIQDRKIK